MIFWQFYFSTIFVAAGEYANDISNLVSSCDHGPHSAFALEPQTLAV